MKFSKLKKKINLDELKIDKYIPLAQKLINIEGSDDDKGLVENVLKEQNGLWVIDRFLYELYFTQFVLNWYANVEIDTDGFSASDYDFVMENGIIQHIVDTVGKDYHVFKELFDSMISDELHKRNSLEAIAIRYLDKLMLKLDDLSNPDKMQQMVDIFEKVTKENPELLNLLQLEKSKDKKKTTKKV